MHVLMMTLSSTRRGQPIGRITDEEKEREEAKRKGVKKQWRGHPPFCLYTFSFCRRRGIPNRQRKGEIKKKSLRRRMMLPRKSESLKQVIFHKKIIAFKILD
jgi:hypothetical protein